MPRNSDNGKANLVDPTTGGTPITVVGSTGTASPTSTAISVPIAPGTTVIRYFIGLANPDKPYINNADGVRGATSTPNNTYVLYRAEFQPYRSGGTPNVNLFFKGLNPDGSGGTIINGAPVLEIRTSSARYSPVILNQR